MISIRRVTIMTFILVTIVSISLVSYSVYLLFGAYDLGRLLNASISKIEVTRSGNEASLEIDFLVNNTSEFAIQLVYARALVYLNGQALTLSNAPALLITYSNPIELPPFSAVLVPIRLGNVPSDKVPTNSSRYWTINLQFIAYHVPLTGTGTYTFNLEKKEGAP
jgi:hypothetical protein